MTTNIGDTVEVYGFDSLNYFNEGSLAKVIKVLPSSYVVEYADKDFPEAEVHHRQCLPLVGFDWPSIGWSGAV